MSKEPHKAERIEELVRHVHGRMPPARVAEVELFLRGYYAHVAPEDLLEHRALDNYGMALAHLELATRRAPDTAVVRVYNPSFDEHGWQSPHTIVEIVTDDMAFLVDSVRMELNRKGQTVHLLVHPTFAVQRDADGRLQAITPREQGDGDMRRESFIHAEIDQQSDAAFREELQADLIRILDDVRRAVEDWRPMRDRLRQIIEELDQASLPLPPEDIAEAKAFLRWLYHENYTFLGYRAYALQAEQDQLVLRTLPDSGLGILRDARSEAVSKSFTGLPQEVREKALRKTLLIITKASARATVHRPGQLDYVGIKVFDPHGQVIGEHRFIGLYTSISYRQSPREIPYLRGKIERVFARSGHREQSHSGKALMHVLETYPRDELFQISEDDLFEIAQGILHLGERQRVQVFVRRDSYFRFLSCLVFVPRDRYNTALRRRMEAILLRSLNGTDIHFTVSLSDDALARIDFVVSTDPGNFPRYEVDDLREQLVAAIQSWDDHLKAALVESCGEARGNALFDRYGDAFPAGYKEDFPVRTAVRDIERIESIEASDGLAMSLYRPVEAPPEHLRFKLFHTGSAVAPSDAMPILENMGVRVLEERPYAVEPAGAVPVWIHDHALTVRADGPVELGQVREKFQQTFAAAWRGQVENDGFNRLALSALLSWREISVLRACMKYLRQTGLPFSMSYIVQTMTAHPHIARALMELFHARFDPDGGARGEEEAAAITARIEEALNAVESLDEDRMLRNFLGLMLATVRTNYYQSDGQQEDRRHLSFKLDTARVPELPEPRPMFEIFAYSPRMEGVHLRGGKVARGGLRWSDRKEDFRTEVLGLMKAQMVKNSVIVPVGSKGGFVVKQPPADGGREKLMDEVVACYREFIRALLDVTDNLIDGEIAPPDRLRRYDGDDPYLVVAADKGTATFSDIANAIAKDCDFWLDDAFASGGSAGYDHKKMGITARGAWESVKLNFRELGTNIETERFTVVGIGDMSGDVFGNGMLLSRHIALIAAFDHRDIFLDPAPDPERSFAERQRLFALPRSSWADYQRTAISSGGGVFSRAAKSVELSAEAARALGTEPGRIKPSQLVSIILRAPVDLLWNGGIGTYVKASSEQHGEVGDKSNDELRVDARELRCRSVGEGGNLGFTQRARIEFALRGGRIDTDFIHNAGGVDCSDHEVNIKILMNRIVAAGDLTRKQRDALLEQMSEEVADLVLLSNYWQAKAISLIECEAAALLDEHSRFMRELERRGRLDRPLEFLPDEEALAERRAVGAGLTRPEIAVLLAYAKMTLYEELVDSNLWEDAYFAAELKRYFPVPLQQRFNRQMHEHPLRAQILATFIVNRMVNRMGCAFVFLMQEQTGASTADVTRAYTIAWEVFGLRRFWSEAAALDNKIPAQLQNEMMLTVRRLIVRASRWLLQNRRRGMDIGSSITAYSEAADVLAASMPARLSRAQFDYVQLPLQRLTEAGVPEALAYRAVAMEAYYCAFDISEVASATDTPTRIVADSYFATASAMDFYWLHKQVIEMPADNHWQRRARMALTDDLYGLQRALTTEVLRCAPDSSAAAGRLARWLDLNDDALAKYRCLIDELHALEHLEMAMLAVVMREIQNLVQTSVIA